MNNKKTNLNKNREEKKIVEESQKDKVTSARRIRGCINILEGIC